MRLIQASAVAIAIDETSPLCGVMFTGASGIGKTSLIWRLIEACPWQRTKLISDDGVIVEDNLLSPPENIAGKIEARGVGILPIDYVQNIPLYLSIELVPKAARFVVDATSGDNLPNMLKLQADDLAITAKIRHYVSIIR